LHLARASIAYGHVATGTVDVGGADGGTATVTVGATQLSVPIDDSGSGSFSLPATLGVGTHTITAKYDGTTDVAPSDTATTTLQVTKAPTTTKLALTKSHLRRGSKLHGTVTVGGHLHGHWPSGEVTISVTVHGRTRTVHATLRRSELGLLRFSVRVPRRIGTGTVGAAYGGNSDFAASSAPPKKVHVKKRR
jgi:hypothetical protein